MMSLVERRREFLLYLPLLTSCARSRRHLIGVVPKATSHLFFVAVHAGVKRAASEADVDVAWNGPQNETDHNRQVQIVDAMVARHVDALAISATDERALAAPVERAIRTGIPVTIFDSGVNVEDYVTFVATDNYGAGVTAARELARLCGGKGSVAMVMHKPGGTSTMLRERGFEETVAKELPGIRIAARQYGMADHAKARAAAENILTAHPGIAGIFASSEASSLGAIQAITSRGLSGKLRLITFDTSDSHIEALEKGTIDIMLVQDAFRIGYEAVKSLTEKLQGRTPKRRLDLPSRVITKADLGKPDVQALVKPETAAVAPMRRRRLSRRANRYA
jgi:ribose transport system substrate-binding protein